MSAPPGWHLQPDGRERFWDGSQWTEQFRSPAFSDPTAPPPAPSWATSDGTSSPSEATTPADDGQTRAMDVQPTQALPTTSPADGPDPYATNPYGGATSQASYPPAYPPAGVPQTGYGAPGDPGPAWQPPQRSGGSGLLKGCLIAVVVGVIVLIGVIIAGIVFFNRAVEDVRDSFPSNFPTELPSDFPSGFPSDLPTEGLGQTITITVGQGFEIPRAQIQDGWSLDPQGALGVETSQVKDMKAEITEGGVPVFFTMSFPTRDGGTAETVCTSQSAEGGGTVDVQCVPILGDVGDATQGKVTTTF